MRRENGGIMNLPANFRKNRDADDGEWQLTFADMMTLLLCFFILIAAISSVDLERYKAVSDVMGEAMGSKATPFQGKKKSLRTFKRELEFIIGSETKGVQMELRSGAVAINLTGAVLFDSASAVLTKGSLNLLARIVSPLLEMPYRIEVEGHSDNIPIKSEKYPSNWELSSARASAVARLLIRFGFPKDQIKVLGMADTLPLVANQDKYGTPIPENQAQNRRVVILVFPLKR